MKHTLLSKRAMISLTAIVVLFIGTTLAVTTSVGASNLASLQAGIFAFLGGGSSEVGNFESAATVASVTTDKADYQPGETVQITGAGFGPNDVVTLQVTDIGPAFESASLASGYGTWTVNADSSGAFSTSWLVGIEALNRTLKLTAVGSPSGLSASTTFTDASIGLYDQCSNDDGDGYGAPDTGCRWINGNLNGNNSTYSEGDSTVQRLWLTGFEPGSTHTVTLQYGTTKAGTHAYDFLTTYNDSETWIVTSDLCQDITGCTTASVDNAFAIPQDPNVPDDFETAVGSRVFTMYGGDVDDATTPTLFSGVYGGGDSETRITVTFTVDSTGSMCSTSGPLDGTCAVALFFGAHISKSDDWEGPLGDGFGGATQIPGSPYHVALAAMDGGSIGNRDNQMQASAVVVPQGTIIIVKDAVPNDAQNFAFTSPTLNPTSFNLDDDGDPGLNNSQTFLNVVPGTYVVSETLGVPDWVLTSIVCVDPNGGTTVNVPVGSASIVVSEGETITCTFTNTRLNAAIEVSKSVNIDEICAGSSTLVTYTYTVTNPGTAPLQSVSLSDNNGTPGNAADDFNPTFVGGDANSNNFLDPGETWTYSAQKSLGATTTNIVTASASTAGGQNASDTASATVTAFTCTIDVTKSADAEAICSGSSTTYDFTVTNNSSTFTWTGTFVDDVLGNIGAQPLVLAPGQTATFNNVAGPVLTQNTTNTATATGAFNDPSATAASDNASDTVNVSNCTIDVTKSADAEAICSGSSTTYDFTVTNNSSTFTWTGTFVDDVLGNIGAQPLVLAPGQTATFNNVAGPVLTQNTTNTATATGAFNDPSATAASDNASDTVNVSNCTIDVTKSADAEAICSGSSTTYDFTVTNNSSTFTWTGTFVDDVLGNIGAQPLVLAPGQTATFNNVAGPVLTQNTTNTATATGAFNDPSATAASDNASDTVNVSNCTIDVTKSADAEAICSGSSTTYDFTVTNNSSTFTWTGTFADDVLGNIGAQPLVLAPGQTATFNNVAGPVLTQNTTNTATATGAFNDPSATAASDNASDTVNVSNCTIDVTKSADAEAICSGSSTTYDFTVTNNSSTFTWTGTFADDVLGNIGAQPLVLAPGQTATFNNVAGPVLTQNTTNTATATGAFNDPSATAASDNASDTVTVEVCRIIVKKITVPAEDPVVTLFEFTGDVADSIGHNETIVENVTAPGQYDSTETDLPGWDLTDVTCVGDDNPDTDDNATAIFDVDLGETITCTFTNTERGTVIFSKTENQGATLREFTFEIRENASLSDLGDILANATVPIGSDSLDDINFDCVDGNEENCEDIPGPIGVAHFPPGTYQFCETNLMPGWTHTLEAIDALDDGDVFVPNGNDVGADSSTQCVEIVITAGGELDLGTIDNIPPPGGDAHTIGFWKNWTSCDGKGNQAPVLDYVLWSYGKFPFVDAADTPDDASVFDGPFMGFTDPSPFDPGVVIGDVTIDTCAKAVSVLSKQTFASRVRKRGRTDIGPFLNLTSQLLAAKLNIQAGAEAFCIQPVIDLADDYLSAYNYNGTLTVDPLTQTDKQNLLLLAGYLDDYNNNDLVCPVALPPAPNP